MTLPHRRGSSLRTQLVFNALLSIALPVLITGGLAFFLLTYRLDVIEASFARSQEALTNDIARMDLVSRATNISDQIDSFLISRIAEAKTWASSKTVVEAARSAHDRHASEGLPEASIEEIENRFRIDKSLGLWPEADSFLRQQVAASPYFAEIFFTDRNGFNVALTNPTSDFVQSDEAWWQSAWSHGISVGEVDYDESAGVWSIEISVRIDDPGGSKSLGVMKTVLAIEPVQNIADRAAQTIPGGRVQVATGQGALIAETHSRHARERIMNADINIQEQGGPSVRDSFGGEQTGFSTDRDWLTGYARTGGREAYASTVSRFAGFDWIVILQKPVSAIHKPITALRDIEDALRDWRVVLALALCAMVLLSAVLAVALAVGAARRYAGALEAVGEMAERSARGERVSPAAIESPEEIVRVNDAVHRLGETLNGAGNRPQTR
ncbi:MAG: PDC sensor domain-containing protein [Rhodospirillales bacterium]|nr:PDC sensor domain-containing protein [Rhodospirillales bacterium]